MDSNFTQRTGSHKPPQATQQVGVAIADVAGYAFLLGAFIAMDFTEYEEGKPGRNVHLYLAHMAQHQFVDERADAARYWYLQLTGQARVEGT